MCAECGYVESYVSDPDKLAEISRKWDKIDPEDIEQEKDSDPLPRER